MNYATDSATSKHLDPRVRTADLLLVLLAPKAINLEGCTFYAKKRFFFRLLLRSNRTLSLPLFPSHLPFFCLSFHTPFPTFRSSLPFTHPSSLTQSFQWLLLQVQLHLWIKPWIKPLSAWSGVPCFRAVSL